MARCLCVTRSISPLFVSCVTVIVAAKAELPVPGDLLMARTVKLDAGSFGSVHVLLLRSFNEVVAPFRQAQVALAWITALGVVMFGHAGLLTGGTAGIDASAMAWQEAQWVR